MSMSLCCFVLFLFVFFPSEAMLDITTHIPLLRLPVKTLSWEKQIQHSLNLRRLSLKHRLCCIGILSSQPCALHRSSQFARAYMTSLPPAGEQPVSYTISDP
ncbi:hypothetical protein EV127DRAFT_442843 [Xylaria flabelliformis]|nr:hypothetical protein EV127DRAFT_442843 [Xylaria flabelliformis]